MAPLPVWTIADRSTSGWSGGPFDDNEAARSARYRDASTALNFLHARMVMRELASTMLERQADDIELLSPDDDRPSVVGEKLAVSWSRSGSVALAAAQNGGCLGADIERVKPADISAILGMVANTGEAGTVMSAAEPEIRLRRFYRMWCAKEALLKWRGQGFRGGVKTAHVPSSFIASDSDDTVIGHEGYEVMLQALPTSEDLVAVIAFTC